MIIPDKQEFKCFVDKTSMMVEIDGFDVMFKMNDENCVLVKDSEQVLLLRDMLTVWLSRQKQPLKECIEGYGHSGHWCGADYNCWLDPRDKNERN